MKFSRPAASLLDLRNLLHPNATPTPLPLPLRVLTIITITPRHRRIQNPVKQLRLSVL